MFTVPCASELSLAFGIQKVNMENYLSEFAGMAKNNVNIIMSYNDVIFFLCMVNTDVGVDPIDFHRSLFIFFYETRFFYILF